MPNPKPGHYSENEAPKWMKGIRNKMVWGRRKREAKACINQALPFLGFLLIAVVIALAFWLPILLGWIRP